jgi:sialate O-acetylesterase
MMRRSISFVLLLVSASLARADVNLPSVLAEGMVVQRGVPAHLWGTADVDEVVTAEFRGEKKTTKPDALGRWHLYMSSGSAGGPFALTISGKNTIRFQDVLVGDVWLASGQSNMEWPTSRIQDAESELGNAEWPQVRLLQIEKRSAEFPQSDVATKGWQRCTRNVVAKFSAIGFLFAREIHQREKVPIGVIDSTWGGTSIESWTSLEGTGADAALMPIVYARGKRMAQEAEWQLRRKVADAAKKKGLAPPEVPWRPDPPMWSLGQLYNAMIAPVTAFPIRGVIWYQGEANTRREGAPELYGRQLVTMISDWRQHWGIGDFPFYYVQLANFRSDATEDWPEVREGQRSALRIRNTGLAVTIDIGNPDDVHPLNKQDVARRLALWARAQTYGESVEYSGPLFRNLAREGPALRLSFDHVGSGLVAKGASLIGFEIAGADGQYHSAAARIERDTIVVDSKKVAQPTSVRYGWANAPGLNLFNQEGLPASPFQASLQTLH